MELDADATPLLTASVRARRRKDAERTSLGLTVQRFTAERVRHDLDFVLGWLRQFT